MPEPESAVKPSAMSLRFPDPGQRAAIATAAKAAGMSMQEYILSAAYERATAVETTFLDAFEVSVARTAEAFAAEPSLGGLTREERAAEERAGQALPGGRGHAA